ncbi:MAG: hypothetical protein ABFQ62_02460 [Patescibacteria group bacterium]
MLTHRTNVLLTQDDYLMLSRLAEENEVSVGELFRRAIKKTYKTSKVSTTKKRSIDKKLLAEIKTGWKYLKNSEKSLDYKKLRDYGRKY